MEKQIKIREDDIDRLMAADMLLNSSKDILYKVITMPDIEISKERFDQIIMEYTDHYMYYEMLKKEISSEYINSEDYSNLTWTIDFNTRTMTLTFDEENHD